MRDDARTHLDDILTLLKGRHVTTRELKAVLRELEEIALVSLRFADEVRSVQEAVRERIRRQST